MDANKKVWKQNMMEHKTLFYTCVCTLRATTQNIIIVIILCQINSEELPIIQDSFWLNNDFVDTCTYKIILQPKAILNYGKFFRIQLAKDNNDDNFGGIPQFM